MQKNNNNNNNDKNPKKKQLKLINNAPKYTQTHSYKFNDNIKYSDIIIHEDVFGIWGGDVGSYVWKISYLFGKYFEYQELNNNQFISSSSNLFIELGSGTGILGMIIRRLNGKIICTEQQHSMPLLYKNINSNTFINNGYITCIPLKWGNTNDLKKFQTKLLSFLNKYKFNNTIYIVIADCIYLKILHEILLETIKDICIICGINYKVCVLLGYQNRNKQTEDHFWSLLKNKYSNWKYNKIKINNIIKNNYCNYYNSVQTQLQIPMNNNNNNNIDDQKTNHQNTQIITSFWSSHDLHIYSINPIVCF